MSTHQHAVHGTLLFGDDESYEAYKSGAGKFNNGLRRDDGTLYRQPDFIANHDNEVTDVSQCTMSNESANDTSASQNILAGILGAAIAVVAVNVYPKVHQWCKTKWSSFMTKRHQSPMSTTSPNVSDSLNTIQHVQSVNDTDVQTSSKQLSSAFKSYSNDISSEDAQRMLLEIYILSALLIKRVNFLDKANIVNRDFLMEQLSSDKYIHSINKILLDNPSLCNKYSAFLNEAQTVVPSLVVPSLPEY